MHDLGIAGLLRLGAPLAEVARRCGPQAGELSDRIEGIIAAVTAAHGPDVTYAEVRPSEE